MWGTERERADVGGERRRAGAGALLGERDPTGPDAGDGGAQSDGRGRRALRRGPTAARRQGTEERRPTGGLRGDSRLICQLLFSTLQLLFRICI